MLLKLMRGAVVATLLLPAGQALAQGLTEAQLITGLHGPDTLTVAIDPRALAAEVQANVGKGAASLPSWKQLSKLTQLAVDINFQYDSVAIVPDSYRTLGLIADALHHPLLLGYKFLIVGHTDSRGEAAYNLDLSLKRAEAIREALATTFAIAPDRLFAVGVGEELPFDAANPEAAVNRRVQLINIGPVE
jgi:outer membrane protein OmpA-like peptidoglycan-associated protein